MNFPSAFPANDTLLPVRLDAHVELDVHVLHGEAIRGVPRRRLRNDDPLPCISRRYIPQLMDHR